ncbi:MAG: type II/IV secretion system protein, partial [Tissierellales bacterium]|nr:type II/IV secretion system protein [Tissierellales bacterium]
MDVLEDQMGIESFNMKEEVIEPEIPRLITENLARRYTVLPVKIVDNKLKVAMYDPLNIFAIEDIEIATGLKIKPVLAPKKDIMGAIDQYFGKQTAEKAVEDFVKQYNEGRETSLDEETLEAIKNAPVVRLVNSIIKQALKSRASDIHIEPLEDTLRIRFRIDGQLQEIMSPSKNTLSAIVTRIKIIAGLNIAEKRQPQDGRVQMEIDGRNIDLRISILPTVHGEKIVIRLLDSANALLTKEQLGFTEENLKLFNSILDIPNGIILVTGPTGSGKSTTLYSILNDFNTINTNIVTVEDPVEYKLDGVNQVQVNIKAKLTFANGLRSILRQDPDIIMIGEIRDAETAEIAVRAAITGHIVLSTIHTNDAPSTIMRLVDMGIKPFLITTSVKGIVAQRLAREICNGCKTSYTITPEEKDILGVDEDIILYKGEGCQKCYNTGYKGRTAVNEIMKVTGTIRNLVDKDATTDEIREAALKEGM